MERVTDMEKIIELAESLVDKELVWKDKGWGDHELVLQSHPIWGSLHGGDNREVYACVNDCIALRVDSNSPSEFEKAKEEVKGWFRACKSVEKVLKYININHYERFIGEIKDLMSVDDLSELICSLWVLPHDREFSSFFTKKFFLEMFDIINPRAFMDDEEYSEFESLRDSDEEIELFRGYGSGIHQDEKIYEVGDDFSWALDMDELVEVGVWGRLGDIGSAEDGNHEDARIYHAFIKGKDILAVYMGALIPRPL